MNAVSLENYTLLGGTAGSHLRGFNFNLLPAESCALAADDSDRLHLLAAALATLINPASGTYTFYDTVLDFNHYWNLLAFKKQIGYFGPHTALISNLTVRQNLLLSRAYFENRLDLDLDETVKDLCSAFHLTEKLDSRPTALSPLDIRAAIVTREITKSLKLMIMDSPEDLIDHPGFDFLVTKIEERIAAGVPLVLICENDDLIARLTERLVRISLADIKPHKRTG